jgi:hypothetical protein
MSREYSESEALENIMRSRGVTNVGLYIEVVRGALGIKRLGMLDFLRYKCKRKVIMVDKATKRERR